MLIRSTIATLVALFIMGHVSLSVESVTVRGRLRNYLFPTKCLRPFGQDNGAEFEISDCSDSSTDQIIEANGFQNLESEAGYIQFDVGGKCVSLNGFSSDNGVHLLLWDCVGQDNQKFSIVNGNSRGNFQLQLKSTGKCMTAEANAGGAYLDQWDCAGQADQAPHQSWTLEVIGSVPPPIDTRNVKGKLRNLEFNTKCLHAVGGDNGAELEIVDCAGSRTDQLIKMESFQDMENVPGYIQFDLSSKCLSLNGFASDNGAHIISWDCVDQDNQKWSIVNGNSGGAFQLQLKSTGKCLTAEGGGTYMDQWDCSGNVNQAPHQSWTLDVIRDDAHPKTDDAYLLRNFLLNTKCLRAKGGDDGAELEIVDCSQSSTDQLIRTDSFQNIENEAAYVQFDVSGKCLSLNGESSDNGVHVLSWGCVDQDNQKWKVINGNLAGAFQLQLKSTGKCLTAEDGGGGSFLDQWDCAGQVDQAPHQAWTIERIQKVGMDDAVIPYPFYQLESFDAPGKCLRYKDGSDSNYPLEIVTCDPDDPSQRIVPFTDFHDELGYSGIRFLTTSKCLDVSGESNANGASVGQWNCLNQANQRWRMENFDLKDGSFRIRTELGDKCLTSEFGGSGSYMDIWQCFDRSSAPHQYWKQRNPNGGGNSGGSKIRVLQNFNWPDKCLHPVGTSNENGAELELINCDSIKPEESMNTNEWLNYDTTAGYVKFNEKCLSMSGFSSDNGVRLIQWDCVDQANQRWQIVNGDIDSNFQLKSEQSGKCLTAEGGGTYMDQWDCVGKDNAPYQSWMIKTIGGAQHDEEQSISDKAEKFFEPAGCIIEVVNQPGKCLTVTVGSIEVTLADCDQFDEYQLFDHTDLLNSNTHPGPLRVLSTEKCLTVASDGHVKQADCDGNDVNELWFVVLGTLFGTFKLKNSQSPKCITPEDGSYTDLTECYVTSDSRRKRDLTPRNLLRLSYKMRQPDGNQLYLIRSAFYGGYCLTVNGATNWKFSDVGIQACNKEDQRQHWHFEKVGPTFQNKFYVRNGDKCLWSNGNAIGKQIDFQYDCAQKDEYVFTFRSYGDQNTYFQLQNAASNLCMQVKWYHDDENPRYVDYIEQQPCGLVGWSAWTTESVSDVPDWNCGPKYGGKFCTGKYYGQCCSKKYGGCGTTSAHCSRLECDSNYGPCVKTLAQNPDLDSRCGPWIATFANRRGTCHGRYARPGYCCSTSGNCGTEAEHCYADNCDPEYGICPPYADNLYPSNCGPLHGNKKCSGAWTGMCCSKYFKYSGQCGTTDYHCSPSNCDAAFGSCPSPNVCMWIGNSKKMCKYGACCSKDGECGDSEKYCGENCDKHLSCGDRCGGGVTNTAGGLMPEKYGVCMSTVCSDEGDPCTIRGDCCKGLKCVKDGSSTYRRKCVKI